MLRICVAIDDWKLKTFEEHLQGARYTWEQGPGLTSDTIHLYVNTNSVQDLEKVVRNANTAARKTR